MSYMDKRQHVVHGQKIRCLTWTKDKMSNMDKRQVVLHGQKTRCLTWTKGNKSYMDKRQYVLHGQKTRCLTWTKGNKSYMDKRQDVLNGQKTRCLTWTKHKMFQINQKAICYLKLNLSPAFFKCSVLSFICRMHISNLPCSILLLNIRILAGY